MIKRYLSNGKWIILAICFSVSLVLVYGYFNLVEYPNVNERIELHKEILNKLAPSPYRYRILVPFATNFVTNILTLFTSYTKAFLLSYIIYDIMAVFAFLILLFIFLRQWFSIQYSIIGLLFVTSVMPITFYDHYFQPWSLLDIGLFTLSLLLIYKKRHFLLSLLIIVATLNRETAIFIPLSFLFVNTDIKCMPKRKIYIEKKYILLAGIYFLLWLATYVALRFLMGYTAHIHSLKEIWARNMVKKQFYKAIVHYCLFLGFYWIFVVKGFKKAPKFIKKLTYIIPIYLFLLWPFSYWHEVRLLMMLYPILISLGLSYISNYSNDSLVDKKGG